MILSFSKDIKAGGHTRPTNFRNEIGTHDGIKIHTIRGYTRGYKRRWRPGLRIDFWMGNPRNKHTCKWMHAFNPAYTVPEKWITKTGEPATVFGTPQYYHPPLYNEPDGAAPVCTATEDILIAIDRSRHRDRTDIKVKIGGSRFIFCYRYGQEDPIEGPKESIKILSGLAWNDGFEHLPFFVEYFQEAIKKSGHPFFKGQLVHWTKHRYHEPTAQTEENPHREAEVFGHIIENARAKAENGKPHEHQTRLIPTRKLPIYMDS